MYITSPSGRLGRVGSFAFEIDGSSIIVRNVNMMVDNELLDCSKHLLKEIYEYLYGKYSDVKKSTSTNKREEIRRKLSDL